MQTSLQISQQKNSIRMGGGGGAGSCLRSCRFSESDDRPSKEICQSFENRNEHARNAKDSCYFVNLVPRARARFRPAVATRPRAPRALG